MRLPDDVPQLLKAFGQDLAASLRGLESLDEPVEVVKSARPVGQGSQDQLEYAGTLAESRAHPSAGSGAIGELRQQVGVAQAEDQVDEAQELLRGVDLARQDEIQPVGEVPDELGDHDGPHLQPAAGRESNRQEGGDVGDVGNRE